MGVFLPCRSSSESDWEQTVACFFMFFLTLGHLQDIQRTRAAYRIVGRNVEEQNEVQKQTRGGTGRWVWSVFFTTSYSHPECVSRLFPTAGNISCEVRCHKISKHSKTSGCSYYFNLMNIYSFQIWVMILSLKVIEILPITVSFVLSDATIFFFFLLSTLYPSLPSAFLFYWACNY